ncbi:MAG TPA: SMI1/KNR4 family protein [Thermoanaerobaculia bacterium]|jgi:hypothetical protein
MSSCLEKLIEIASVPQCSGGPSSHEHYSGDRFAELLHLCTRRNGFFAFESALHVFPVASFCSEQTFQSWNTLDTWKYAYGGLVDDIIFFAEDIFGDQFGISDDAVVLFRSETGEVEPLAASLEEWASQVLVDFENLTGYWVAHEWQLAHGPIARGMRLTGKQPFVLGGGYDLANLYATDSVTLMRLRGDIYRQIRDLPDGAHVKLRVER